MSAKQNDQQDRDEQRSEADAVRSPKDAEDAVRAPEKKPGFFLEPFDVSQW